MIRILTLLGAALLLAAPALAQSEATVHREGATLTVTLPDGTVQTFDIGEDTRLRVIDREGRASALRGGEGPREIERFLAYRAAPGPDGEAIELRVDSLLAEVPVLLEERLSRLNLPRIWVERDADRETRREIVEGERRSQRLALEARRAEREGDAAEAERLRRELRQTLEEVFDLRQQARRERAERLREQRETLATQAEEIAEEVQAREQNRRAIIERREQDLLGDRDELDW